MEKKEAESVLVRHEGERGQLAPSIRAPKSEARIVPESLLRWIHLQKFVHPYTPRSCELRCRSRRKRM